MFPAKQVLWIDTVKPGIRLIIPVSQGCQSLVRIFSVLGHKFLLSIVGWIDLAKLLFVSCCIWKLGNEPF